MTRPRFLTLTALAFCLAVLAHAPALAIEVPLALEPQDAEPQPPAADTTTVTAAGDNAMLVMGQDKFLMKSQREDVDLNQDIHAPAAAWFSASADAALTYSPVLELLSVSQVLGNRLQSNRVLVPVVFSKITEAPFIVVRPKLEYMQRKSVESWAFQVAEGGRLLWERQETGKAPPSQITWDGRDAGKKIVLKIGGKYRYEFACFDQLNNVVASEQKTAVFNAFCYDEGDREYLHISSALIFKSKRRTELAPEGKELLNEAADAFRNQAGDRLSITLFADSVETAREQAQVVQDYLSKRLTLAKNRIGLRAERARPYPVPRLEIEYRLGRNP